MTIKRRVDRLEERARPQWEKDIRKDVADGLLTREEMLAAFPELDPTLTPEERRQLERENEKNAEWWETVASDDQAAILAGDLDLLARLVEERDA